MRRMAMVSAWVWMALSAFAQLGLQPAARVDLAAAYLRLEESLALAKLTPAQMREANRAFDEATLSFFAFQYAPAMRRIHELTRSIAPAEDTPLRRIADALRVRVEPAVGTAGRTGEAAVGVGSFYALALGADAPRTLRLRLMREGSAAGEASLLLEPGAETVVSATLRVKPADGDAFAAGEYAVELSDGERSLRLAKWYVTPTELDALREGLERDLSRVRVEGDGLRSAIRACRARVGLLTETPSDANSAEFLLDPIAHAAAVGREIEALAAGKNPYAGHAGELWRVIDVWGTSLALRTYAPASVSREPEKRRPVVLAFHGAGGDEQMFFGGYGAGRIKALADQYDAIVAAPETTPFLRGRKGSLQAVLEVLSADYAIDRSRVYAIGHSMGAAAAGMLAQQQADAVAAAVLIAGGGLRGDAARCAPTLVVVAELDRLAGERGAERASALVDRLRAGGAAVELRREADFGHTLVVGHVLPEVFAWLWRHELTGE